MKMQRLCLYGRQNTQMLSGATSLLEDILSHVRENRSQHKSVPEHSVVDLSSVRVLRVKFRKYTVGRSPCIHVFWKGTGVWPTRTRLRGAVDAIVRVSPGPEWQWAARSRPHGPSPPQNIRHLWTNSVSTLLLRVAHALILAEDRNPCLWKGRSYHQAVWRAVNV